MEKNSNLSKAKTAKNDEFYTQLTDIEKELRYYKAHLCENNNHTEIEPIDYFYPNGTNLKNTMVNDCTINGKKTYVRMLIRKKAGI